MSRAVFLNAAPETARHAQPRPSGVTIAREDEFDFRSSEYATLYDASSATAFQHPLVLDALYSALAPHRNAEKHVLVGRDRTGRLAFVLPLLRRWKAGVALLEATDLGVSDYACPIVANGFAPAPDLAQEIAEVLPTHDILRIRPVREETVPLWAQFLVAEPRQLDFSAHATDLRAGYEAWRSQALEPGFVKYLDRRKKRFLKSGEARLRLNEHPDEIAGAINAIRMLRAGRFDGDLIQHEVVRDFYTAVAVRGAAVGLARTYSLMLDGQSIGHVFGLTHAGRFNYLLIGCDYETHGRHSPGLILYDTIIEDWVAAGGSTFDFTIGDEPFKADFGTVPTPMYMLLSTPTWRGRLARATFDAREQLARLRRKPEEK